jgi:5-amino-6-(5-phosphoribosylamino)uracil reductase
MADIGAVRFTLLAGGGAVEDDDLDTLYAYPPDARVLRANMIASVDGAATVSGKSGGLGGAGDRRLFAVQRELADVIVVGAGTARAENYGGARMSIAQRRRRQARGQSEVPPIALVTRSGVLERDLAVLTGSEVPPLVLTCAAATADAHSRVGSAAEVIDCSAVDPGQVDLAILLDRLAGRGLRRVLTEGGPSLLGAFIAAGLLDDMCLTSAPVLVGGSAVRIAAGDTDALTRMRRAHVLTDDDGYLYSRYVRA